VARGPSIQPQNLPASFLGQPGATVPIASSGGSSAAIAVLETASAAPEFDLSIEAAERDQIRKALEAAGGKRMEAARLLGLSRRTLYRKLDKYGIT
jgi:transcriptional regulator of acetoin/glycerol metabolism